MIYDYRCASCGNVQEEECSHKVFKELKPACIECGLPCDYEFNPTGIQFVLKDGPSGSWPSKGIRINKQMIKSSLAAKKRQDERYKNPTLVPNLGGVEAGSWRDVQADVMRDKGPAAAATYNSKVKAESKSKSKSKSK